MAERKYEKLKRQETKRCLLCIVKLHFTVRNTPILRVVANLIASRNNTSSVLHAWCPIFCPILTNFGGE
jgi:hypothetical protein